MALSRRSFLRLLGIGAGAAAVAPLPALPAPMPEAARTTTSTSYTTAHTPSWVTDPRWVAGEYITAGDIVSMTPDGVMRTQPTAARSILGIALRNADVGKAVMIAAFGRW